MEMPPRSPLAFVWHVSRNKWRWASVATCAVIVGQTLSGGLAIVLKNLIDAGTAATSSGDFSSAWFWAAAYPSVFLVQACIWRLSGFAGMRWVIGVDAEANRTLFAYLSEHGAGYFANRFAGALTNKIANASRGSSKIVADFLWQYLSLSIKFATGIAIALLADWRLALVLAVWIPVFLGINVVLLRWKRPLAYGVAESSSTMRGKMVDIAGNIAAVHQAAHQEYEREYLEGYLVGYAAAFRRSWIFSELVLSLNGLMQAVFTALMIGGALLLLSQGLATVGVVVMISTMVVSMQDSLFFIGQRMNDFVENYSQLQEGLNEILVDHDVTDAKGAKPLKVSKGAVRFDGVKFAYAEQTVFSDLSLEVAGGQKVGIVGLSGAGKSTLVNLLLRQYDIQGGVIAVDGQDIATHTKKSLRSGIALVPQDTSLFHRSILENIRYGRLGATDDEVKEAARLAQADAFIERLPQKYESLVGERGVKLSGGQRQRIAIARAFLKNAPILVLDEATSSLDSESEALIQHALETLMQGKTVLAIAHRLSTLRAMDRIVVLDSGKVVEDGTHKQLIERNGIYAKLWKGQVGGFIVEE